MRIKNFRSVRSDLKKLDSFTLETSKNPLIRTFLRNGRLRVNWRISYWLILRLRNSSIYLLCDHFLKKIKIEDDDIFNPLIQLMAALTSSCDFPEGKLTKIDEFNKKTVEKYLRTYKQSFNKAYLWVKLRKRIGKLLMRESNKSLPGQKIFKRLFQV